MTDMKKLREKATKRGIGTDADGGYERHVLVCVGGDCSSKGENAATLKMFRKQAKALEGEGHRIYCTPVECLQLCKGGPLVVVYPEGTWYHSVSPEIAERIANQHFREGEPVHEHILVTNPMMSHSENAE